MFPTEQGKMNKENRNDREFRRHIIETCCTKRPKPVKTSQVVFNLVEKEKHIGVRELEKH